MPEVINSFNAKINSQINGEIIYAIPTPRCTRVVYLKIDNKIIKVYGVPVEQPLNNIPVCKHHGKYYWIMPWEIQ